MNILVVGDVHGCYHTFHELVEEHWNPKSDFLVQVGDLINKGRHSAKTVKYIRRLQKKYPYQVFVLKGNHEDRYLKYHDKPGKSRSIDKTRKDFIKNELNLKKLNNWLKQLPYKWENPYVLITHAGISETVKTPYTYSNPRGVLHNRSPLKNIGKLQVFGHIIQNDGKMVYYGNANAWCLDSGAWTGTSLSAIRLSYEGEILEHIQVKTKVEDLKPIKN